MTALRKLRPAALWEVRSAPGWGPLPEILLALTLLTGLLDLPKGAGAFGAGVTYVLALLLAMVAATAVLASRKSAEWRPVAPAKPVTEGSGRSGADMK